MKNILEIGKFKCKKMTTNKKNNNTNAPLLLLLSIISIIGCIALYFAITKSDNTTKESLLSLLKSLIPNVICALLVFPILYYFYKKGISTNIENISISENQKNKKEFISCYKSYHNIKWKEIISSAKVLDIVVIYFDSWAITYRDELINYFKDGGKIRLILMNPDSEFISIAAKRFHENNMTIDELKNRITQTISRLKGLLLESQSNSAELDIYFYNDLLNYTVIRVDNKKIIFSIFEHFPGNRVASPSFLIDLKSDPNLKDFWEKEIGNLMKPQYSKKQ